MIRISRCILTALTALPLFVSAAFAAQDLAVFPYAVETVEKGFTAEAGTEYAKLVSLGARVEKDISTYPSKELEKDLGRLGLDPQGKITAEDLALFCKSRYLNYIITGRISKVSGGYVASSVLYSAAHNAVIARASVKGSTLAECATRETAELLVRFDDAAHNEKNAGCDVAVVLDTSYTVSRDWTEINRALVSFSSTLVDQLPGSRIHLVTFAESFTMKGARTPIETVPAMKDALASVKLKGGGTGKALGAALSFALENTPWRSDSSRQIIVIANSPIADGSLDRYGARAKRLRIKMRVLTLGSVTGRDAELYKRLSLMTDGASLAASYRQTVFDNRGDEYFLYMNRGRLFEGDAKTPSWKEGVIRNIDRGTGYAEPPVYADEVAIKGDTRPTPYTMAEYYRKKGTRSMLNAGTFESNVEWCISSITEQIFSKGSSVALPVARVLLSSGGTSIWVSVVDPADLAFFRERMELGFVFPLGVRVMLRADEPFGMTFNPQRYVTGVPWEDLPEIVRVDLPKMAKEPSRYARDGFLTPPLYFVNVKVEQVQESRRGGDIREGR
jgi:hypothetical protein